MCTLTEFKSLELDLMNMELLPLSSLLMEDMVQITWNSWKMARRKISVLPLTMLEYISGKPTVMPKNKED